jgi:septal ring-binding cell division protein DamX
VTPTPTTLAAKPLPTPKPATKPAGGGLAEARQLLEQRDYGAAARGFASSVRSSNEARFSVQLLVACSEETVGKAVANASGPDLLILPVNYKGKSCYRLCWGLYESEARASSALGSVPAYFREGGAKPKVSPTAGLLP